MDDGVIKYEYTHQKEDCGISASLLDEINGARRILKENHWLGVQDDGVGYGNISLRVPGTSDFWITGSGTGELEVLESSHIARVLGQGIRSPGGTKPSFNPDLNIYSNHISSKGLTMPSSEAMSHAAIYMAREDVTAVIHIHSAQLWTELSEVVPATGKEITYGTPEMAFALRELSSGLPLPAFLRMEGHENGLIGFGAVLIDLINHLADRIPYF